MERKIHACRRYVLIENTAGVVNDFEDCDVINCTLQTITLEFPGENNFTGESA